MVQCLLNRYSTYFRLHRAFVPLPRHSKPPACRSFLMTRRIRSIPTWGHRSWMSLTEKSPTTLLSTSITIAVFAPLVLCISVILSSNCLYARSIITPRKYSHHGIPGTRSRFVALRCAPANRVMSPELRELGILGVRCASVVIFYWLRPKAALRPWEPCGQFEKGPNSPQSLANWGYSFFMHSGQIPWLNSASEWSRM